MITYIGIAIGSGLLFAVLDGLINANPLARKQYRIYEPLAKRKINFPAGLTIDVTYGFAMSALFRTLYGSLPGRAGIVKGLAFAGIAWFFRVAMGVATEWVTREVPPSTLLYTLATGLGEMLILGILYGLTLGPWA